MSDVRDEAKVRELMADSLAETIRNNCAENDIDHQISVASVWLSGIAEKLFDSMLESDDRPSFDLTDDRLRIGCVQCYLHEFCKEYRQVHPDSLECPDR